jgi:hypothetical protein
MVEKRNILQALMEAGLSHIDFQQNLSYGLGDIWRSLLTGTIPIFRDTESAIN